MILVQSFSGTVHKASCYTIRGSKPNARYAGVEDPLEFIRARRLEACRSCFPDFATQ